MIRLWCRLGFHRWVLDQGPLAYAHTGAVSYVRCARCRRKTVRVDEW